MGAEHDDRSSGLFAFTPSDDVTRRIHTHGQAGLPHQLAHVLPALYVGFTKCHPADATVWILPEFTQLQDALLDPLLIPAHG
jgi:hypothetical protein